MRIGLAATIGSWTVDSTSDAATEIVEVTTHLCMNSPVPVCRVDVYSPPAGATPLAGAASVVGANVPGVGGSGAVGPGTSIRGLPVSVGDRMTIELTAGDVTETVATAQVEQVRSTLGIVSILGRGALQDLASARVNAVFESQTAGQIIQDLAGRVGVTAGEIEDGLSYPYLVVHESRSILRHILDLASRDGMDVYEAPDGSLNAASFSKTAGDVVLRLAAEVLDVEVQESSAPGQVVSYGESSASNQGTDTWHWLLKDGSPLVGSSGSGNVALALQHGAVRTKEAADRSAAAFQGALSDAARLGRVRILGNPAIQLGHAIEIADSPRPELAGVFKVTSVRHRFSRRAGFVTELGFSAAGGLAAAMGGAAGGAVGGASGAAAGGLGL